ncbi:agroclavine dehydrogenase [Bisporella sp. PMI_857]|nr:agroclavine dehydrogenase [Bisporella sp. PMI_857]KAH8600510.1 agroclavine dehydrogenase [Bisporella sp. PMI_857]
MTILLLGGRGTTSSRIAPLLHAANIPFLVASRSTSSSSPYTQAQFDYQDEKTYTNILMNAPAKNGLQPVSMVWLVPPPIFDLAPPMIKFVNSALESGVKRFVLLSASEIEKGGPAMGQVHEHLDSLEGVDYAVLRPTWFMGIKLLLYTIPQYFSIKNENKIFSAAENAKIPFLSADDVARVACKVFAKERFDKAEYIILGPQLLTYDQVADTFTNVLGRSITHIRITESEAVKRFEAIGIEINEAQMLASMDTLAKTCPAYTLNSVVKDITGLHAQTLHDFVVRRSSVGPKLG